MTLNIRTPYLQRKRRHFPLNINRQEALAPAEELGGYLQGEKAYSTEIKYAQGLERAGLSYIFHYIISSAYNLPGQENQIDFLVDGIWADEVDGEIGHKTESQKNKDALRDLLLSPVLQSMGINPIINRIDAERFTSNSAIDRIIQELHV